MRDALAESQIRVRRPEVGHKQWSKIVFFPISQKLWNT